jgi:MFS family permease
VDGIVKSMSAPIASVALPAPMPHAQVIFAASLGTGFEWYDFFLYGSLADVISKQFFAGVNETSAFIFALLTFGAGFAVRPFGALLFGTLGDLAGRKRAFLMTIVIMGLSTVLVGALPSYHSIGLAAPVMLIALRMLQGLAIGGEYGGAVIYVAEHAPPGRRGRYTSWIQTTATLALLLSLIVILICRAALGADFERWGWRIPFLVSSLLLVVSVYIRLQLSESPVFMQMVAEGTRSRAPLRDAFGDWRNLKLMLSALAGGTAGMNVIWYGGQLYALYFLTQVLKVEAQSANLVLAAALVVGTPLYLLFGRLSDRLGRKHIVVTGMALAALTYFPIYHAIAHFANPAIEEAAHRAPVSVLADPGGCSVQFDPVGRRRFTTSCDLAKGALAKFGVPYSAEKLPAGSSAVVRIGAAGAPSVEIASFETGQRSAERLAQASRDFSVALEQALRSAGYPVKADPARINYPMLLLMLVILLGYVTVVTGPMAAWLTELFPARIRYTSMSVSYHIGAGWFGGFMPAVAFALVAVTGDIYSGLWYLVAVVAVSAIAALSLLPETAASHVTRGSHAT